MSKLAHSNDETMNLIEGRRIVQERYPGAFAWTDVWKIWHICNRRMHGDSIGRGNTEAKAWVDAAEKDLKI